MTPASRTKVVLTKTGEKHRTHWDLPDFFKDIKITYHNEESHKAAYFQSVDKGQEFVIEENPKVTEWAKELITENYDNTR
jgi:hypothetical protein